MKAIVCMLLMSTVFLSNAQSKDYNSKKGYAAKGYDVVAYFDNKVTKGEAAYMTDHDGIRYKFSSQEHLKSFKADPEKYKPQYGGYCAYAIAVSGKKVDINPETYEIRDGKLYLFYNSGRNNTLELWKAAAPDKLKIKADANWDKIKSK